RRRDFRGSGTLEAWVWRIVVNAARDARRRRPRTVDARALGRRLRAVTAARPAERAPARGRLPPLLRGPRLRRGRGGPRDQPGHGRRDADGRTPHPPQRPPGGEDRMTELDLLDRAVPRFDGAGDWQDVLRRARPDRRRRRALTAVAVAAAAIGVAPAL